MLPLFYWTTYLNGFLFYAYEFVGRFKTLKPNKREIKLLANSEMKAFKMY